MAEPQQDTQAEGEYVIVAFELQGSEDEWEKEMDEEAPAEKAKLAAEEDVAQAFQNLVYYPVDWNYQTEKEAWAALHQMAAGGALPPGEYGVIKLCTSEEILSVEETMQAAAQ